MKKTAVTVIIPGYKRPQLLIKTLKSVYNQVGDFKLNVIVMDDHSPQPLKPFVKKYFPHVKVIRNRKNLGSGLSRNQGFKYINSPYVAFLDADDLWRPQFLAQSIRLLESHPQTVASMTLSRPLFASNIDLSFKLKLTLLSLVRDAFQYFFYLFNHTTMPHSAFYLCQLSHLVFRTAKIKNLRFDLAYIFGGEDWQFTLQAMDHGPIKIIPKRLVRYRYHKKSATHVKINLKNKWNSYRQLFAEVDARHLKGPMIILFHKYIDMFKS